MIFLAFEAVVEPEDLPVLVDVAERGISVCRSSPQGTLFYNWYRNSDTGAALLIEGYDSTDSFAAHLGALRNADLPATPGREQSLTIAGDLGDRLKSSVAKWPGTTYFGPAVHGIAADRAKLIGAGQIDDEAVCIVARLSVPSDDAEAFAGALAGMVERTRAHEPGVLAYEWFGDPASGEWLIFEAYRNEEAFVLHHQNVDPEARAILRRSSSATRYFGGATPTIHDAMSPRSNVSFDGNRMISFP